jgi:D-amino peptidase
MKIFIAADLEGVAGISNWAEATPNSPEITQFLNLMTNEVNAAVKGALRAGATYILVKDAHWFGRNIQLENLHEMVDINRSWSGDPLAMVEGIDETYNAVIMIGCHARASVGGNPLAHTITNRVSDIIINKVYESESSLYSKAASLFNVPTIFISGDQHICEEMISLLPDIHTVKTSTGYGARTVSISPQNSCRLIENHVFEAIVALAKDPQRAERLSPKLTNHYDIKIVYKLPEYAYRFSFYPDASLEDARTVGFQADNYYDILRFIQFATMEP